jgi:hypothetical protein
MWQSLIIFFFFPSISCSGRKNTDSSIDSSLDAAISLSLHGSRFLESSYPANYPFGYEWNTSLSSFQPKYYDLPADSRSLKPDFLTAPPSEPFKYHGQSKQDIAIVEIFHEKENGYFIDLAANEWQVWSNTYVLEYFYHWKGICIEASPQYITPLLANRKCKLFVNPVSEKANEIIKFHMHKGESGIIGNEDTTELDNKATTFDPKTDLELVTTTLMDILDFAKAPSVIDYLSLDIEGAEYFAMKGFDFSRYTILLMTIERPKPKLHYLLIQHGYRFLYQNSEWGDCFYVHHTIPEFVKIMNDLYGSKGPQMNDFKAGIVARWFDEDKEYMSYPPWNQVAYVPFDKVLETSPFPHDLFKGVVHKSHSHKQHNDG